MTSKLISFTRSRFLSTFFTPYKYYHSEPFTLQRYFTPRFWITLFLTLLVFDRWSVYNSPLPGLDGSWAIAIHIAQEQRLMYGSEFIFTYGPLSWLLTRLPISSPEWALVLFDALWLVNIAVVVWAAVGSRPTLWRSFLLLGLIVIHKQCAGTETPFGFYFFVLFYLAHHFRTGNLWALTAAICLAILTFYLKANVGLVSLISVVFYGIWRMADKKLVGLATVCGLLILLWLSTYGLPVAFFPYAVAQWHMIDSYNDIMYTLQQQRALTIALVILSLTACSFIYGIWCIWQADKLAIFWKQDGLLFILIALQLFVLFKEAFVRADAGHTSLFYKYALLPLGLVAIFSHTHSFRHIAVIPIILIALTTPLASPYHWDAGFIYRWIPQWLDYGQDIVHPQRPTLSNLSTPWPGRWLSKLRNKRVDIIPHDVSLLYANQLHYAPRPIIQTYQVTDGYLDSLNATYLSSPRAPDYILVSMDAIDNRDPFADEPRTKLALLQTYELSDTTKDLLLLQRRPMPLKLSFLGETQDLGRFNEKISVPNDSTIIQLWQIKGRYQIWGSLARLLFQPPRLKLEITYQTGERIDFRTALPLLNNGLLFSVHCRNNRELSQYWQSVGKRPSIAQVRSFQILTDNRFPASFNPSFIISRRTYRLSTN